MTIDNTPITTTTQRFKRPTNIVTAQDNFGATEVGITHPSQPTHIRATDTGDIELIAGDGVGIVLSMSRKCITMYADQVKILTNEDNGLRWNKNAFNVKATDYSQPALVPFLDTHSVDLYKGVEHFMPATTDTSTVPGMGD